MTDIALVFPPQWSPFQPPLSVPSLAAWLRREGYSVGVLDANIEFYHWLYDETCISWCKGVIDRSSALAPEKLARTAVLNAAPEFAADIAGLQKLMLLDDVMNRDVIRAHFVAINSMELYLDTISKIAGGFTVSPFAFSTSAGDYNSVAIQKLVEEPPPLLELFVDEYLATKVIPLAPRSLGLSCIGQEQLFFSLLFAKRAKQLLNIPILIGGTIFSRIFERGTIPLDWFKRYIDIIVRNEGERPASLLLHNLVNGLKLEENVPGIVYRDDDRIIGTAPAAPLKPHEVPIPDFDDVPLQRYITGHLSLPLLASRGCYWGKCEFCHHGMTYGDAYGAYAADGVLTTVQRYAQRYGVKHFAFNDEAIPPKTVRRIGLMFPDANESAWAFTGLIKFERYYTATDFANLRRIGFRSLYVGLESASERVLTLMRKPNTKFTIKRNLTDAAQAGIWMHCFLFFGFPGETEEDAKESYDFILENDDIIGSFGCGTFALEHNAPMSRHLQDFVTLQIKPPLEASVNVYYHYSVSEGISPERADELAARLNGDAQKKPKYFASDWIPREHLLSLLTFMSPEELVAAGIELRFAGGVPSEALTRQVFCSPDSGLEDGAMVLINRSNQRVLRVAGASADVFRIMYEHNLPLGLLREQDPKFFERFTDRPARLGPEAV